MKQTKNVTLSLRPDVAKLLKQYADATRQSQSRAVSELVIAATNEEGHAAIGQGPGKLGQADRLPHSYQCLPQGTAFSKVYNKTEFCRFLSPQATTILLTMCMAMDHRNLIQMSQDDAIRITGIGNKGTVSRALDELLEYGAVAIKVEGNSRRAAVYMVNPNIATASGNITSLEMAFWKATGTEYAGNEPISLSASHKEWEQATACRTYDVGRGSLKTQNGQAIAYNCIKRLPIGRGKEPKGPKDS